MKNMKKVFTGLAIAVALSASSSVFADSGSKFSAFDGVPTEAVSRVQLDEVSGEALLTNAQMLELAQKALNALGASAGVSGKLLSEAGKVAKDLGQAYGYSSCKATQKKACQAPQYDSLLTKLTDAMAKKVADAMAVKPVIIKPVVVPKKPLAGGSKTTYG